MALMRYTSPTIGDSIVNEDLSVTTDGVPNPNAVVSFYEGVLRLDVTGSGIIDANAVPELGHVTVSRQPGWQGSLGYRVVLDGYAVGVTPNAIALAIYNSPNGVGYRYTTGAFLWDAAASEWYVICPPGFEPGQNDIYMGMLFGSLKISAFTMRAEWDVQSFPGGGDF